jgi:hypothetical protein
MTVSMHLFIVTKIEKKKIVNNIKFWPKYLVLRFRQEQTRK